MSRRVDLPSGGYLMIDYAEALTVIDVNSGSFTGRGRSAGLEETITRTNLEAAEAVVDQLRLRDIGGIIVIDFIDMARARNRDAVMKTLRKSLDEDRTKTFTAEISKLGLVEMTRQNVTEGVREIMSRPCPTCDGDGVIRSEETFAIDFERRLREIAAESPDAEAFLVQINPRVTAQFTGSTRACCTRWSTTRAAPSTSRAPKGSRWTTSRSPSRGPARRWRSARCRSTPATRCWWRSWSPTCTTWTTRLRRSTATSSRSRAPPRTWARSGWCASSRWGAPRRARCCSTRTARWCGRAPDRSELGRRRPRRRAPRKPRSAPGPSRRPPRRSRRWERRRRGRRAAPSPAELEPVLAGRPAGEPSANGAADRSEPPGEVEGEDAVQSKPRRRGRRGGRRRSAAKAGEH